MVFDNADVLSPAELEAYLPPGRGGNILITSRNFSMRNLTSPENCFEVTEMEENDAIELLLKASCLDQSSIEFQADASKIVKELFCLPLAIDQAGQYFTLLHEFRWIPPDSHGMLEFHWESAGMVGMCHSCGFPWIPSGI